MLLVTHYVWLSHLYVICLLACGEKDMYVHYQLQYICYISLSLFIRPSGLPEYIYMTLLLITMTNI